MLGLFPQEQASLAYDAVQVISQALNREPCSSINGTTITSNERDTMLTCIIKVTLKYVIVKILPS